MLNYEPGSCSAECRDSAFYLFYVYLVLVFLLWGQWHLRRGKIFDIEKFNAHFYFHTTMMHNSVISSADVLSNLVSLIR